MNEPWARPRALFWLVLLQMLPATLLTPAIRPLFAALHGGAEGPMHAFMSVNMLAAAISAPWVGARLDRSQARRRFLRLLGAADGALLLACTLPQPVSLLLGLRFLEGAAHVGAATLLLTEASSLARRTGRPEIMGVAGAGIMAAVALGNSLGALLVGWSMRAPFWVGAGCAAWVALRGPAKLHEEDTRPARGPLAFGRVLAPILVPVTSAFVARFTVGTLVVTFALFAHRAHALSDRAIGGLYAALTVPFALATYPAAKLARRLPRALLLACGTLSYAATLLALAFVPTSWLAPAMLLGGLGSAGIFASTLGYVSERAPVAASSRGMAMLNAAGALGMLLGPVFAGVLSAQLRRADDPLYGYRAVFIASASALAMWLVLALPWLGRALHDELAALRAPRA